MYNFLLFISTLQFPLMRTKNYIKTICIYIQCIRIFSIFKIDYNDDSDITRDFLERFSGNFKNKTYIYTVFN